MAYHFFGADPKAAVVGGAGATLPSRPTLKLTDSIGAAVAPAIGTLHGRVTGGGGWAIALPPIVGALIAVAVADCCQLAIASGVGGGLGAATIGGALAVKSLNCGTAYDCVAAWVTIGAGGCGGGMFIAAAS